MKHVNKFNIIVIKINFTLNRISRILYLKIYKKQTEGNFSLKNQY